MTKSTLKRKTRADKALILREILDAHVSRSLQQGCKAISGYKEGHGKVIKRIGKGHKVASNNGWCQIRQHDLFEHLHWVALSHRQH